MWGLLYFSELKQREKDAMKLETSQPHLHNILLIDLIFCSLAATWEGVLTQAG